MPIKKKKKKKQQKNTKFWGIKLTLNKELQHVAMNGKIKKGK